MMRKNYSTWIQHSVLILSLSICSISSAFDRICVNVIPGAWFLADIRLGIVLKGAQAPLYIDEVNTVRVNVTKCFSIDLSEKFAGAKIVTLVHAEEGATVGCTPSQVVKFPSYASYTYNTWGTTISPFCNG